jgi:hypothetical protein
LPGIHPLVASALASPSSLAPHVVLKIACRYIDTDAIQECSKQLKDPYRLKIDPRPLDAPPGAQRSAHAEPGLQGWYRLAAELAGLVFMSAIAAIACATGAFYVLFPELGALSHDVFTRPRGTWCRSPVLLAITPVLTALIGTVVTRNLAYGYLSVLLNFAGATAVILALRSPIAPAISAGLLPLVLGVTSWWYPPGIVLGTVSLALLSVPWRKTFEPRLTQPLSREELADNEVERAPTGYFWLLALFAFVTVAVFFVKLTGLRFILFPPLVVIGFEMFGHPAICPWAGRPLLLPVACFLTAAGGLLFLRIFGVSVPAAACSMAWGALVLRLLDLHVPPAMAVALLPLVMDSPTVAYPLSVALGTLLLTLWFLLYRAVQGRRSSQTESEITIDAAPAGGEQRQT